MAEPHINSALLKIVPTYYYKVIILKAVNIFLNSAYGRARFILWFGFLFNLLYALWGLVTGIFYRSAWFGAVAVYYILLCIIKFFLIRTDLRFRQSEEKRKSRIRALRSYRNCGYLLALLNISMVGIVFMIVIGDKSAGYSGIVLFVMGGYTIIRLVISVVNITKLRHIDDPLLSASKSLGISVTLMSVFSLQTALLSRFCRDAVLRRQLNGTVGFAVSVAVIMIALYMISKSRRKLKDNE